MVREERRQFGGIPMEILWKTNMKNFHVRAYPPDGRIRVTLPASITDRELESFLATQREAIEKLQKKAMTQEQEAKPSFTTGDICYLWGKPYRLEVIETAGAPRVFRVGETLCMYVPKGTSSARKEALYEKVCQLELKKVYPAVARACEERTGLHPTEYRLKNMKTRWGTCNVKARRVWLSTQLAKKPPQCLEYVLTHELTHLVEKNHNVRFYALVEQYCPDWREAERLLNGKVAKPRP